MGKSMTGIERLRDIAYDGPYSGGMVHISVQRLREICEQDEVKKRLAPGGCRPLLGIDGNPIVPGGVYYGQSDGKRWRVDAVGALFAWAGLSKTARMRGEGPKRLRPEWLSREPPEPKVLDADGVEIRAGDTVWHVDSGREFTVDDLPDRRGYCGIRLVDGCGTGFCNDPDLLTHKRPEIDRSGLSERDVADVIHALLAGLPGVDADWIGDIAAQVCSALGIRAYGKRDGAR